ncbi:MAG: hypothetical protein SPE18_12085 [Candidatus Limivicinus sp.]|nr:hypothetical protein [Candidatus Limivicinus sp.]
MAEFTPIMTQEDFDAAISARLERERSKYSDYDTIKADLGTLRGQLSAKEAEISTLQGKVKGYETDSVKTRIALETGLPLELRSRLTGETEEEIRADATKLAKLFGQQKDPAPLRDTEPPVADEKTAAYKSLLNNLKED